ncbi:MAG: hypothetical protein JNL40_03025 [Cyclobacteriaceae bacterium]|nr:hypothetical protein [Cyclobacteriaceae bacterium]
MDPYEADNFIMLRKNAVRVRPVLGAVVRLGLVATALLLTLAAGVNAQSDSVSAFNKPADTKDSLSVTPEPPEVLALYAGGLLALPSAEFRSTIHNSIFNLAAGLGGGLLINPFGKNRATPILLGFDFNYLNYAIDYTDATATMPPLKTSFNIFTYSLVVRARLTDRTRKFTPFADGMIGIREFATTTKVDKNVNNIIYNTNQPEVISRISDTGLNFGLGAGFTVGRGPVVFTCRLMFLWGREVDYVIRNSVVVDANGYITYSKGSTTTSLLALQVGMKL